MVYHDNIIIGAGASGMMCGYLLGKEKKDVLILEKNPAPGKKILASGNGRCNFTNQKMQPECYYGDREFVQLVLECFGSQDAISLFEELGMFHRERDGYCYPYSGQASVVVELLMNGCQKQGVTITCNTKVSKVLHKDGQYQVRCKEGETYACKNLILATGGKANESLGGDGSGYKLGRSLGHQVTTVYPALTGLIASGKQWKELAGVRMQGKVTLVVDGEEVKEDQGEVQIVKDGISGIPVFQLCRLAAKALGEGKYVSVVLDFFPELSRLQLENWLERHGIEKISGLLNTKWSKYWQKKNLQIKELAKQLKAYEIEITDTFGMEKAQVTAGGVPVSEVDGKTMESRICENLYLLGELLDVDGICGGYNLHFAWATAWICSRGMNGQMEGKINVTV